MLIERNVNDAKKELNGLKEIVRSSLQELRKIIFNLRPSSLDDLGIRAVAKRYCEEFQEETGISVIFCVLGDKTRLDSDIEVTLFRVLQEILTNIKKHSKARECTVKLEFRDRMVNMLVFDDGIGFDVDEKKQKDKGQNFGILTMKERIALIEGNFSIETAPNQGTKIFVTIPYVNYTERRG